MFQTGVKPRKIVIRANNIVQKFPDGTDGISTTQSFRDLALVILNDAIAPSSLPMAKDEPKPGSEATLVGFGLQSYDQGVAGDNRAFRQVGKNKIAVYSPEQAIYMAAYAPKSVRITGDSLSKGVPSAGRSLSSFGDSGGPLLVSGQVVGVVSSGGNIAGTIPAAYMKFFPDPAESIYASTFSDEAKTLVTEAKAAGAEFTEPGLAAVPTAMPAVAATCLH